MTSSTRPHRTRSRTSPATAVTTAVTAVATATGTALAGTLLVVPSASAAVTGSTTVRASYACSVLGQEFDLPVEFDLSATPSGGRTVLTASGGRPTLPLDSPLTIRGVTSTMAVTVNGRSTTLSARSAELTAHPGVPLDLPSLSGTVDVPGPTLTFRPGTFSMTLTAYGIPASISCDPRGEAPTSTLGGTPPVPDGNTTPPPASKPAEGPRTVPARLGLKPAAKSVKRSAVRKRGTKARVRITLKGPAQRRLEPVGTLVVTVGKKKVRTMRTSRATVVRVQLPRTLGPGKHRVRATFQPSGPAKASGVGSVRRSVVVRVVK